MPSLVQYVDEANYTRSCLYLVSTCAYLPPPDDQIVLQQVYQLKFDDLLCRIAPPCFASASASASCVKRCCAAQDGFQLHLMPIAPGR